jgi:hypothetical protein
MRIRRVRPGDGPSHARAACLTLLVRHIHISNRGEATEAARSTFGAVAAVAEPLLYHVDADVLDAARAAFTDSLRLSGAISAGVVAVTAVLAAVLLRRVGTWSRVPGVPPAVCRGAPP